MAVMLFAPKSRKHFWNFPCKRVTISSRPDQSFDLPDSELVTGGACVHCAGKKRLKRVWHHPSSLSAHTNLHCSL